MAPGITIYDTTLRDGAAQVGLSFSLEDKVKVLQALDAFGIDLVEGGYPASNAKDAQFFAVAKDLELAHCRPSAFGHTRRKDTEAGPDFTTLLAAATPTVCIFGKSWTFHVTEVLRTTLAENLAMIETSVAYLKAAGRQVVYDAEHFFDGHHEDEGYALECLTTAQAAGADWIVLCDTNGGMLPAQVERVVDRVAGALSAPLGIHAHNDSGCAVANSLAAVRGGATMVQGTINGYGERCGNADLTAVLPNLCLKLGYTTACADRLPELTALSHFVAEIANTSPDTHQPYVGQYAFGHKGGAHVAAVSRDARCYEHIEPTRVGNRQRIVVSEISGKKAVAQKAVRLGLDAPAVEASAQEIADRVKALEHEGYHFEAADASFEILVRDIIGQTEVFFELESFRVIVERRAGGELNSEATIKIHAGGRRQVVTAEGNGPVHALDQALRAALAEIYPELAGFSLVDYKVRVLDETKGTSAVVRVLIESSDGSRSWGTVGVSGNVLEASWRALAQGIVYGLIHARS